MQKYPLLLAVLLAGAAARLPAQTSASQADSALSACAAAAEAQDEKLATESAERATALFDELHGKQPVRALTGKARVISQCRIPFAPMLRKGALIQDSNDMLTQVLSMDSLHFAARYVLALNYFRMPEFLGQTDKAVFQFERLVNLFGNRSIPEMATVYQHLGDAYMRKGRKADAIDVWRRGAALFPGRNDAFQERLLKAGAAAPIEAAGETQVGTPAVARTDISSANPVAPVYDIDAIVVEAGRFSVDEARGSASLKRLDVITMPGGTADVLQVFQSMPGVTRTNEGSDLYVRGGDPAEAPVFVDGARMTYAGAFETLHGGIFGVLDPNIMKKADFSSGGFSARYGNALSGVLDITTEGRLASQTWRAGVNLVSASATIRKPVNDKVSVWGTGKLTETSALLWTQGRSAEYSRTPLSVSSMAGATYAPSSQIEVKATGLTEFDRSTRFVNVLGYRGALQQEGATHMATVTARALNGAGNKSVRGTASAARRATGFAVGVLDRDREDDMYTVRFDGDLTTPSGARIRAGVEGVTMRAHEQGAVPTRGELAPGAASQVINARSDGSHAGAYVETEMALSSKVAFIAGARSDRLPGMDAWTVDPRLAVAYRANGWTVRAGAGVFHQGPWRTGYRTPDPGAPSGVATRARHVVVGLERESPVFLRVEAFMKHYDQYSDIAGALSQTGATEGPPIDAGKAVGIDALLRWTGTTALSGWISYSYLDGRVRLREAAEWIPSATDVRHTATAVAKLAFADNWEIGTTARFASGRPFTPVVGSETNDAGNRVAVYGDTHVDRMPGYTRLDARLTRLVPARGGLLVFYVEGLNLFDRRNVMAYTYDSGYSRRIPVDAFFANRTLVLGAEAMF